jgi:hypothetical protein
MAMLESAARGLLSTAARIITGREPASLDNALSNAGVESDDQLSLLIQWITQAVAQAGYKVSSAALDGITRNSTFRQVLNIVIQADLSPPKTCSQGHPAAPGQTTCDYGHPAS